MSNPWSLAGMIEEKRLKVNTFVVASLCSTLINTFTASINLWDRVNERRKQQKKDSKQDDEIRKLKEQVAQTDKHNQKPEAERHHRPHDGRGGDDDYGEALGRSLERSESLVRREYNNGAGHMGKRFAMGDLITENQLQAQIITLQEALLNRHSLSHGDVQRLIAASLAARNGSLDALRQQYQRLSFESYPQPISLPGTSHRSSDSGGGELFCKYSLTLQSMPGLPLSGSFAPGGDGQCPSCRIQLDPETTNTYWHIEKKLAANTQAENGDSTKEYHFDLGQRFIVKCHTERGE
ncbi:hypothetical protein GQX73_g2311 [Xylaria multiplex]|uniref:Uncharacterized protein n=1 Tax=Xylaria multiplex TaxID=323545 RepID=A0A7C8IUC5_9PEZI|nr:hypothetical protein GQX73_g2311 [Xylaria multiplex]